MELPVSDSGSKEETEGAHCQQCSDTLTVKGLEHTQPLSLKASLMRAPWHMLHCKRPNALRFHSLNRLISCGDASMRSMPWSRLRAVRQAAPRRTFCLSFGLTDSHGTKLALQNEACAGKSGTMSESQTLLTNTSQLFGHGLLSATVGDKQLHAVSKSLRWQFMNGRHGTCTGESEGGGVWG